MSYVTSFPLASKSHRSFACSRSTISTYIAILLSISLLYRCKSSVRMSGIYAFRRHVPEFSFTLPTNSTAVDALGFRRRSSKSHFIHGTTASVRSVSSDFSSSSFYSPFRFPTSLFSLFFSISTASPHSSSFTMFVSSRFSLFSFSLPFSPVSCLAYMTVNIGPGFHLYSRTSSANLKAKGEQKPDPSFCICAQA